MVERKWFQQVREGASVVLAGILPFSPFISQKDISQEALQQLNPSNSIIVRGRMPSLTSNLYARPINLTVMPGEYDWLRYQPWAHTIVRPYDEVNLLEDIYARDPGQSMPEEVVITADVQGVGTKIAPCHLYQKATCPKVDGVINSTPAISTKLLQETRNIFLEEGPLSFMPTGSGRIRIVMELSDKSTGEVIQRDETVITVLYQSFLPEIQKGE